MIAALQSYEPLTALGILSRAAFSIESDGNPAASIQLPNESIVRQAVLDEMRSNLGVLKNDLSETAIEKVSDALDAEMSKIVGDTDVDAVLEKMSEKGQVPGDLYKLNLVDGVKQVYREHWYLEQDNIFTTVRDANREQHFTPILGDQNQPLISLFSREFTEKIPSHSFTMLVIGQRSGLDLTIHDAWKVYADEVSLIGAEDLVGILKRFSNVYGREFKLNGVSAKFLLNADIDASPAIENTIEIQNRYRLNSKRLKTFPPTEFVLTHFVGKRSDGTSYATLTFSIDLIKYRQALKRHGWT